MNCRDVGPIRNFQRGRWILKTSVHFCLRRSCFRVHYLNRLRVRVRMLFENLSFSWIIDDVTNINIPVYLIIQFFYRFTETDLWRGRRNIFFMEKSSGWHFYQNLFVEHNEQWSFSKRRGKNETEGSWSVCL